MWWISLYSSLLGVNSLCVSQLITCCLRVLLGPVVTAHTPPAWARTVHLQDVLRWHETHWREEWHRERGRKEGVIFQALFLCLWWQSENESGFLFLPGKVVLTVKLDIQVISSSPPAQSSFPSQALSIGMNFTERAQKKYLLTISCLTGGKRSGTLEQKGRVWVRLAFCSDDLIYSEWQWIWAWILHLYKACFFIIQAVKSYIMKVGPVWHNILWCLCVSLEEGTNIRNCDSLKYPAVASIPSNTTIVKTVSNTFFLLDALSFWVFGAVMGLLWRPGRGTTRKKRGKAEQWGEKAIIGK